LEKQLIKELKSNDEHFGYNVSSGGEFPAQGVKMSKETKEKMSESHKGIVFTEERKRNMSIAAKKRGNNKAGKIGALNGQAGIVRQIDMKTNAVVAEYYGFYEMERETGFSQTPVKRAARGEQKQSHGYYWEYIPRRLIKCRY
jgi:hypothetical protein